MPQRGLRILLGIATGALALGGAHAGPSYEDVTASMKKDMREWRAKGNIATAVVMMPPPEIADALRALTAQSDAASGRAPLAKVIEPRNPLELFQYTIWLQWKILAKNADGRYSYAYAIDLEKMKDRDGASLQMAAVYFYNARLALAIDGARCADHSGADNIVFSQEMQPAMQPLIEKIRAMTDQQRAAALVQAVAIEEMRGERPAFAWLCNRSGAAAVRALQASAQLEAAKPGAAGAPDNVAGRTATLDVSGVAAEFVAEPQWRKERADKLESTLRRALDKL